MTGFLTNQRLWGCTNFVDHVSYYFYMRLLRYLSLAETLFSKEAMVKTMARAGWAVNRYHADNGRFSDNGFIGSINTKYQTFHYLGLAPTIKMVLLGGGGGDPKKWRTNTPSARHMNVATYDWLNSLAICHQNCCKKA